MIIIKHQNHLHYKSMSKEELTALKEQMLLNILSAKGIYYTYYKNKQLNKGKQNDIKQIRSMATNSSI